LQRLQLLSIDPFADTYLVPPDEGRFHPGVRKDKHRYLVITDFGRGFLAACRPIQISEIVP